MVVLPTFGASLALPPRHKKEGTFRCPFASSHPLSMYVICFATLSMFGLNICRGSFFGSRRSLIPESSYRSSQDCQQFPSARSETPKVSTDGARCLVISVSPGKPLTSLLAPLTCPDGLPKFEHLLPNSSIAGHSHVKVAPATSVHCRIYFCPRPCSYRKQTQDN